MENTIIVAIINVIGTILNTVIAKKIDKEMKDTIESKTKDENVKQEDNKNNE